MNRHLLAAFAATRPATPKGAHHAEIRSAEARRVSDPVALAPRSVVARAAMSNLRKAAR